MPEMPWDLDFLRSILVYGGLRYMAAAWAGCGAGGLGELASGPKLLLKLSRDFFRGDFGYDFGGLVFFFGDALVFG